VETSLNMTSQLKQRAHVTWSEVQSRADTVRNAGETVALMELRVTSAMTQLMTSQSLREAVNETLNELESSDVSEELKNIGNVEKQNRQLFYGYLVLSV